MKKSTFKQLTGENPEDILGNGIEDYGIEDDIETPFDFEECDECDRPDACSDFGCAIKQGIKKPII